VIFLKVFLFMKRILFILLLHAPALPVFSQYYIKGEIKTPDGHPLQNVTITLHTSHVVYKSGAYGGFGIPSPYLTDTFSFALDGYQTVTSFVIATTYVNIILKPVLLPAVSDRNRLNNYVQGNISHSVNWTVGNESYSNLVENAFMMPLKNFPVIFTPNTNQASYSNIRRFIHNNERVPPDAVRIEEMLNYFNAYYSAPGDDSVFSGNSLYSGCPWNARHRLLLLNICARKIDLENIPAGNLVFLVDASGSMDQPNKLPLLKAGLRLLIKNLRPVDTVSIVAYGGTARIVIEGISGAEKDKIEKAVLGLNAEGDTPGEAGIKLAYKVVNRHFIKGGNNRIILASDGDFNVGRSSEEDLEKIIGEQPAAGIYLTCLGVGMGNYKDSKLWALGQKGNGDFSYLDNEAEAGKVLLTGFTRNLYAVADKVYMSVFINPAIVLQYRLIGYENNGDKPGDTTVQVEGGQIGSGHSVTALFEIVPKDTTIATGADIASVVIHYKLPGTKDEKEQHFDCPAKFTGYVQADSIYKKAAGIALFGMLLKGSLYTSHVSWAKAEAFIRKNFNTGNPEDKEFISLVQRARKIYSARPGKLHSAR
jgi:Ca-activated chloride channel homolog